MFVAALSEVTAFSIHSALPLASPLSHGERGKGEETLPKRNESVGLQLLLIGERLHGGKGAWAQAASRRSCSRVEGRHRFDQAEELVCPSSSVINSAW